MIIIAGYELFDPAKHTSVQRYDATKGGPLF
jgi:hypothetical protein